MDVAYIYTNYIFQITLRAINDDSLIFHSAVTIIYIETCYVRIASCVINVHLFNIRLFNVTSFQNIIEFGKV